MKKNIILMLLLMVFAALQLSAQPQDNNFQKYYSDVQAVVSKPVESLKTADLEMLRDASRLDAMAFGAANQKLVKKIIQEAKSKKDAYDIYLAGKEKLKKTEENLDESNKYGEVQKVRGDSLYTENLELKEVINRLTKRVGQLEKESKRIEKANKKLAAENLETKELLQTSRTAINRILSMMPAGAIGGEMGNMVPASLQDSLKQSECQVAQLLKNNYLLTMAGMQRDEKFLDSASQLFRETGRHLPSLEEYFLMGNELIGRLRSRNTDCTSGYASDIENDIEAFKLVIENRDLTFGQKLAKFFSNNLIWIIPLLLAVIVLIVIMARKKKPVS